MKGVFVFLAVVSYATAAPAHDTKYVWELLKPALTTAEVMAILNSRDEDMYPIFTEIPPTDFNCASKKQPGFYADGSTRCQIFHRCDINGNLTSYMCVNSTLFNQITLVCDYFYNVDCQRFMEYDNFANSRLYTDQHLFDDPPYPPYVPPYPRGGREVDVLPSDMNSVHPGVATNSNFSTVAPESFANTTNQSLAQHPAGNQQPAFPQPAPGGKVPPPFEKEPPLPANDKQPSFPLGGQQLRPVGQHPSAGGVNPALPTTGGTPGFTITGANIPAQPQPPVVTQPLGPAGIAPFVPSTPMPITTKGVLVVNAGGI